MIDALLSRIDALNNPTVVGLDPTLEMIPSYLREEKFAQYGKTPEAVAEMFLAFNRAILAAVQGIVPAVKPQIAFYERYGLAGLSAYEKTAALAKEMGFVVIGDIKRNDIGATASAYAEAYLGKTRVGDTEIAPYGCDSVTVNGYLGTDGVEPFLKECRSREKSLFLLVKTSNPSSGELQNRDMEGKPLYARMAEMVAKWGEGLDTPCGYNQIGAVVGATYPEEQKIIRELLPKSYFLVPGYGAQGAKGTDIAGCFDANGNGAIVNASRSILCAWKKREGMAFDAAARDEALRMKQDLCDSLAAVGTA